MAPPDSQLIYTGLQVPGMLPSGLTPQARNVVIFNSSEDEFATLEDWSNPHYRSQNEGLAHILGGLQQTSSLKLFVRVHPNLKGLDNAQTRQLQELARRFPGVEFIAAESPISTYALVDAADAVLTFGSTVGVEALYRRKPSILMGGRPTGSGRTPAASHAAGSATSGFAAGRCRRQAIGTGGDQVWLPNGASHAFRWSGRGASCRWLCAARAGDGDQARHSHAFGFD